jgi:hypothetical protein
LPLSQIRTQSAASSGNNVRSRLLFFLLGQIHVQRYWSDYNISKICLLLTTFDSFYLRLTNLGGLAGHIDTQPDSYAVSCIFWKYVRSRLLLILLGHIHVQRYWPDYNICKICLLLTTFDSFCLRLANLWGLAGQIATQPVSYAVSCIFWKYVRSRLLLIHYGHIGVQHYWLDKSIC